MATRISNGAAATSLQRPPQRNTLLACSICEATFSDAGTNNTSAHPASATTQSPTSRRNGKNNNHDASITKMPRIGVGGLDASFVNIPHYPRPQHVNNNNGSSMNNLDQNVHDIESILDDALRSSSADTDNASDNNNAVLRKEILNGADMYEASRRMDKFVKAAMELLSGKSSLREGLYCQTCLDRIGTALDTCTERLEEECIVYNNAASAEEERTVLLANVLSMSSDANGVGLDDFNHDDDGAIHRAIDSFQYDIDTLVNACDEQMKELQVLQSLMKDQTDRSNAISNQEDMVHEELNNLEIDARNFGEEAHLVSNSCSAIENEIDKMSRVKLMSIPFKIQVDWEGTCCGKYPTINNLRIAYRVNEKAGLHRDEINAAFSNAAQLMAFTLGLYPSLITPTIRIIPIHPCAKILVHLPEGQSVHNLGFDANASGSTSEDYVPNHVPSQSITLFLVLLSELASHIQKSTGLYSQPPFEMTGFSIDNVDVTKLAESNTSAWSSVVFCVAANLCWLSELQVGQSHV